MVNKGKISIVIPCYNHGKMLCEALESVEKVRNSNLLEVIIVNDGSTDAETCKLFQELTDSKYKIIHQPNRGLGAARNAGIQIAQGEFILPLDSDNRIREAYLTHGVRVLMENPQIGVVYGDAEYFGEKIGVWQVPEFNLPELTKMNFIDACALYRKSVWESIQGYDQTMPWMGWEDWDFWLRAAACGWIFSHLNEIAFDYRVRSGSMIGETNRHSEELLAYIFGKHQNQTIKLIRKQNFDLEQLRQRLYQVENSRDYRLGHLILEPARRLKKTIH
jgi:glycosyltransferase involved in cell wall biosynthesis